MPDTHPDSPRMHTLEPDAANGLYQTLLESTLAIPFRIDWESKKYTYVGPQIESLLGWSQDSWQTVDDWAERIHPDERDAIVTRCVDLCIKGVDHDTDYRALTKDKGFVWVREVVHVLRDAQGKTSALIGFTFDITERKKAEQVRAELEQSNALLQERLRLTHDLHDGVGGALVHMLASVELVDGALPRDQVLSMLKLLRNDLRHSIDSNSSAQVRVPATPGEWMAPLRHRFTTLFDALDVACDWQCAPTWGSAQPQALQYLAMTRLIEEALTNVIKHSHARHVRLSLEQPVPGDLVLEIEDDGVGFDVAAVNAAGLGIGMRSMAARIARVGGALTVTSKPGRTVLTVRLALGQP